MSCDLSEYSPFEEKDQMGDYRCQNTFRDRINDYFTRSYYFGSKYLQNYDLQDKLRQAMVNVYTRENVLFCIDAEAYELDKRYVTELGISIYDPRGQQLALFPAIETFHIVISENEDLRNSKFVPDHKDNFIGGVTYRMSNDEASDFVQSLVDYYFTRDNIGCCLVGHDVKGDIRWFSRVGIRFPSNMNIADTKLIYSYSHSYKGCSLANVLQMVQIPYAFLHNAGNDAYYTLILAMKLCDPEVRETLKIDDLRTSVLQKDRTLPEDIANGKMRQSRIRNHTSVMVDYYDSALLIDDLYIVGHNSHS